MSVSVVLFFIIYTLSTASTFAFLHGPGTGLHLKPISLSSKVATVTSSCLSLKDEDTSSLDSDSPDGEDGLISRLDQYSFLGWSFSYPNLEPYSEKDLIGLLFLATNLPFFYASYLLYPTVTAYSILLDVAGLVSLWYHYCQLKYKGSRDKRVIQALLVDYTFAFPTVFSFMFELAQAGFPLPPLITGALSISCLLICWVYDYGFPYIFFHGLWHILAALGSSQLKDYHLPI